MIAHISISKPGAAQGVSTVVDQFESDLLYNSGHRVFRPRNKSQDKSSKSGSYTRYKKNRVERLKSIPILYFFFMLHLALKVSLKIKLSSENYDLIVCHDVFSLFFCHIFFGKRVNLSLYNHSDSSPFVTLERNFPSKICISVVGVIKRYLKGKKIVAVFSLSEFAKNFISEEMSFQKCEYKIINNFIVADVKNVKQNIKLKPKIWMVGSVCSRKRQVNFFEKISNSTCWKSLFSSFNINVLGTASPNDIKYMETLDFVDYHGVVKDVSSYFNTGDIILSVSSDEGLPMSFIEAASKGLIIISTDVGGCNRICIDNVNGVLFDYNDKNISRVIDFLSSLMSNKEKRAKLSDSSLKVYASSFSQNSAVEYWEELRLKYS